MNLKSLFARPRPAPRETAPQITLAERRHLALPGVGSGLSSVAIEEMQRDSMVQTALTIKKLAVLANEFQLLPFDSSTEAARRVEFMLGVFDRMEGSPRSILTSAMDAFAHGWSVQELVYRRTGSRIELETVRPKDPAYFGLRVDAFGRLQGLTLQVPGEPARDLPRARFIVYRNREGYSRPKGRSDLEAVYPHFQAKRALVGAWRAHLERFASPTVMGRYARGLPADEQNALLGALSGLHENKAVVFPNEIEVSSLHGRESDNNAFQDAIEFHNREIARALVGQTLTTDEGRRVGSLALGRVHLQVLMLQIDALRRELADRVMTEQVIKPLVEMNFGPGKVPRFEFAHQPIEAFVTGRL